MQDKLDWLSRHTRYLNDDVRLGVQRELGDSRRRALHAIEHTLGEVQKLFQIAQEQADGV